MIFISPAESFTFLIPPSFTSHLVITSLGGLYIPFKVILGLLVGVFPASCRSYETTPTTPSKTCPQGQSLNPQSDQCETPQDPKATGTSYFISPEGAVLPQITYSNGTLTITSQATREFASGTTMKLDIIIGAGIKGGIYDLTVVDGSVVIKNLTQGAGFLELLRRAVQKGATAATAIPSNHTRLLLKLRQPSSPTHLISLPLTGAALQTWVDVMNPTLFKGQFSANPATVQQLIKELSPLFNTIKSAPRL